MSLNEKKCYKHLPDMYLTEGICRSKSFAGLSHRRTNSIDASFMSADSDINFDSLRSGNIFGPSSSLSSAKSFIHGFSSMKAKIHKTPRPERMQSMFSSLSKGLKDSVHVAQTDISSSRVAFDSVSVSSALSQGRLYELEKQMKSNERLLKKLEFHLSKIEELKEQYDVQHRMRDGIRSMAYAYILSPGKEKESALQNVKVQFKECTDLMCCLENKLEELMGTLLFEMKGIQGFARICCGDVFEVVIKHGEQKWKSRGRVLKNGEQLWENKFFLFKSLFNDPLYIKAVEVRGLGKNIVIGNKFCETKDLFSVHPQKMTINLNPSGSLKLNLVITWNPLSSGVDGITTSNLNSGLPYPYGPCSLSQSSMHEVEALSELSLSTKQCLLHDTNFCDKTGQSLSSESTSASAQSSAVASPDVEVMNRASLMLDADFTQSESNSVMISSHLKLKGSSLDESDAWSEMAGNLECHSSMSSLNAHFDSHNLTEVLKTFCIMLEDASESYPEVRDFLLLLEEINKLLKQNSGNSFGSNISISVESALGCFDFLNTAIENDDLDGLEKFSEDNGTKVSDQSSSFDVNMVTEDNQEATSKCDSNSFVLSSGNEHIDIILTNHLVYCTKLLSILLASNPLLCIKHSSLNKLQRQISIFSILLHIMKKNNSFVMSDIFQENEFEIQNIWLQFSGEKLYCVAEQLYPEMERIIKLKTEVDGCMASIVCSRLICDILDTNQCDPSSCISVFQFKIYFSDYRSFDSFLHDFLIDTIAIEDLKGRDVNKISSALSTLLDISPSCHCLHSVASLLIETNEDFRKLAMNCLKKLITNEHLQSKAISMYLEMLQSECVSDRLAACAALDALEAKHCSGQIKYIADNDIDPSVQQAATTVIHNFENIMESSAS